MLKLTIDGKQMTARPDQTILEVAKENGIAIPTLCYHARLSLLKSCRICLVDVEGAEIDVMLGAQSWMDPSNLFLIEVHKGSYLATLKNMFAERGLVLMQVGQKPLPLLGREQREFNNWWLVSDLAT